MNTLITSLARLLIFPGLLFAVPCAWFFLWVERKAVARMQGRIGPPFMQPFFDFIKLMGKTTPERSGIAGLLMRAWPLIAVSSAAGAVGLLPVLPASGGFQGDLILLLALLELPSMCIIAAGFSSGSIFGEIGSAREAVLSVSYNIVFLLAILSIAASQHTFSLSALALLPSSPLRWLGIAALRGLLARQAALESLFTAQCRAGDLLRTDDRVRRTGAGHVGAFAWVGMGCSHWSGSHADGSRGDGGVAGHSHLHCNLLRHRTGAVGGGLGHGAPAD